jgi:hypothetical protein
MHTEVMKSHLPQFTDGPRRFGGLLQIWQFAKRNVVASNNGTAIRPQAAWGA